MEGSLNKISAWVIAVAAVVLCAFQFFDPYLWFDESGQFFLGMGLNHYDEPFSARGGLHDVLVNNRAFNLDPGGFSFLVYGWTFLSTSVYFLRLLPLLFFAASVWLLYRILDHTGVCGNYRPVCLGIYVIFGSVFSLITEFRAYPMELCGTLMTLWLYLKYADDLSYKHLLLLSLVMGFFCTSRYSFILVAFVLAVVVLYSLYRKESFRQFIPKALVFGLPLLAVVAGIYLAMTRQQDSETLDYVGYIGRNLLLLASPLSLLFYANIVLWVIRYRRDREVPFVLTYTLLVSALFFVLSLCSLFPWDLKRTVSVTLLNLVSLLVHFDGIARPWARKPWAVLSMEAAVVLCMVFLCYKTSHRGIDQVAKDFEALDMDLYERVYIPYDIMPDVKYQYEFGRLRSRVEEDGYPDKFVFEVHLTRIGDTFETQLLKPEEVDCDLYFNIKP